MQIDTGLLFSLLSIVLAAGTFFIGRTTAARNSGTADGEMKSDIKYIKNSIEKQDEKLGAIVENYEDVKLEIERLKGRIKNLEQRIDFLHGEGGQT